MSAFAPIDTNRTTISSTHLFANPAAWERIAISLAEAEGAALEPTRATLIESLEQMHDELQAKIEQAWNVAQHPYAAAGISIDDWTDLERLLDALQKPAHQIEPEA